MKYTPDIILSHMDAIGKGAYGYFSTLQNSYDSATHCIANNIEGDFVECGVGAGSQIAAMALACQVKKATRTIWAFDSFLGIPMADPEHDTSQPGIGDIKPGKIKDKRELLVSSGITVHDLNNVKSNMRQWDIDTTNFKFIQGWFEDTVEKTAPELDKIAILRLDGDLYHSTAVCLEHLFPKLVSGGILIIDDWQLTGCRKACDEYFKKLGGYSSALSDMYELEGPVWFIKR